MLGDVVVLDDYPVGTVMQEKGTNRKCTIRRIIRLSGLVFFAVAFQDGERRYIVVRERDVL